MKKAKLFFLLVLAISIRPYAQGSPDLYQIPKELLAGEGLELIKRESKSDLPTYQKKVYDGTDMAIFMLALGTNITNEFDGFPMEEFIFWINGKAIVEPLNQESFEVHAGDYFIQAKGFQGKWNFVDNGDWHLELALIAKNRSKDTENSPITKALVIDRDILSGVSNKWDKEQTTLYNGVELTLNLITSTNRVFESSSQEKMIHVLNGTIKITQENRDAKVFYPGDFFVLPEGFIGTWESNSQQKLRAFEVSKTRPKN